jgi:3-isopropylmalate/(R)-2-methylmalate dehydratase small subunit
MSGAHLVRTGRTWLFGDNINTDLMMPNTAFRLPKAEQHKLTFEALRPGWAALTQPGDIIVAGRNFGLGSSRPIDQVLRACGIAGIVADSVNGLCQRTLVNGGLPALSCPGVSALFREGETAGIDYTAGRIENRSRGTALECRPLAPLLADIIAAGGVMEMLVREGFVERDSFIAGST